MRSPRHFRRRGPLACLLWPSSLLFCALVRLRRGLYRHGLLPSKRLPVPVIVVGNLTVGGVGKTPLVIHLVGELRAMGWTPGVVARGYRGESSHWPLSLGDDCDARLGGDEPCLIARRCRVPVCVGPDRPAAARQLLDEHPDVDVLLSDDGLQHYRLRRDLELAVVDAARGLENGLCLPAGPLREPRSRLDAVDMVLYNGNERVRFGMAVRIRDLAALDADDERWPIASFSGRRVHAVAGIGNPERFFATLERAGIEVVRHPFPDHHAYHPEELRFEPSLPILMTEKDAVKCRGFGLEDAWQVRVDLHLNELAFIGLRRLLREKLQSWRRSTLPRPDDT